MLVLRLQIDMGPHGPVPCERGLIIKMFYFMFDFCAASLPTLKACLYDPTYPRLNEA